MEKEWITVDGFIKPRRDTPDVPGHGNSFLETGLAYACGLHDISEKEATDLYLKCTTPESYPLFFRTPYKKNSDDHETADDWYGLMSLPLNKRFKYEIFKYIRSKHWNGDVQKKSGFKYNFGRFISLPCFVSLAGGGSFTILDRIILSCTLLIDSLGISDADGNKKAFLRGKELSEHSSVGARIFKFWCGRVRKKYGTIGGAWAESFEDGHPLSAYDGENLHL